MKTRIIITAAVAGIIAVMSSGDVSAAGARQGSWRWSRRWGWHGTAQRNLRIHPDYDGGACRYPSSRITPARRYLPDQRHDR